MRARLAALGALVALSCLAADGYRVAGVVVDAARGAPMPHMRVHIGEMGRAEPLASILTGADGRFAFDLPRGSFHLYAVKPNDGESQVYGLRRPGQGPGCAIMTGPDQDTANLTFRWFQSAAISGKVLDEYGEPVENALVQVSESVVLAGKRTVAAVGLTRTDDRGDYRIGLLPGGTYYLAVAGKPWFAWSGGTDPESGVLFTSYAPAYYPGVADVVHATPLAVTPGQEARADFRLTAWPGAAVTVQFTGPADWNGAVGLTREGFGGTNETQDSVQISGGKGNRVFQAVPPGQYLVVAEGTGGSGRFMAQRQIAVSGAEVSVDLSAQPAAVISGVVRMQDPGAKLPSAVYVTLTTEGYSRADSAAVRPDGTFSFSGLLTRRWKPGIRGGGLYATEFLVEGAELRDGMIDAAEGQKISMRVTASDRTGRLRGFAMRGGKPVPGVLVVAAPPPGVGDASLARGFQTDSDGSFDFENMKPGEYLLFGTEEDLEYQNPAELRRYADSAKRIRIEPQAALTENVTVK